MTGTYPEFDDSDTLTECPECGTPVSEMEWREKVVPSGVRIQHLCCPDCGGAFSA